MSTTGSARETALGYPLENVRMRYQRLHHVEADEALRHERELKRYLVLCSEHPDASLPIAPVLDDFWHEFLLHTHEYMNFCSTLGNGYIHHVPMSSSASKAAATRRYAELLSLYEEEFREPPPPDVWPRIGPGDNPIEDCSANGPPCDGAWVVLDG